MADIVAADKIELARALRNIEENLAEVLSSIQKLNEESRQAKAEITEVFGRQLSHLHGRETQLLRQVDVIFHARSEVLQNQLAYCYRLLGALKGCNEWNRKDTSVSVTAETFSGSMKRWSTSSELNWNLDEPSLNEAIANFGHVDMDGVLMLSRGEQSKCLPARIEEYFEDDHQVLNKPLHSMDPNIIEMKFPKLPKDYSFWLSSDKSQKDKMSLEKTYGPYRKGVDNFKPCDVQTWLGCIQGETAAEPMDGVDESMPDIVSLSDTTSTSSKTSESIEIVSSSMLYHKANEYDSFKSGICNQALVNVEIESLGDMFNACLNDKQNWLASASKRKEDFSVSKVCRANSICETLVSCVSDTNCKETARKNRDDKEKQLMNNILQMPKGIDIHHWLHPVTPSSSISTSSSFAELTAVSQLSGLYSDQDNSKWLPPVSVAHKAKDDVNLQVKMNSMSLQSGLNSSLNCDSPSMYKKWLRGSNGPESPAKSCYKEDQDLNIFADYQNPLAQWLKVAG